MFVCGNQFILAHRQTMVHLKWKCDFEKWPESYTHTHIYSLLLMLMSFFMVTARFLRAIHCLECGQNENRPISLGQTLYIQWANNGVVYGMMKMYGFRTPH